MHALNNEDLLGTSFQTDLEKWKEADTEDAVTTTSQLNYR